VAQLTQGQTISGRRCCFFNLTGNGDPAGVDSLQPRVLSGCASGTVGGGAIFCQTGNAKRGTSMRTMLRLTFPTDLANGAIKDGSFQQLMDSTLNKLKPEAVYFTANKGCRCAMIFFDMQDAAEIPSIAEPLFVALNAEIELLPVMNADDLKKGLSAALRP
jgi:hypothetical protein